VAEGSPRQLIERYSTREVVEVRFEGERPETLGDFDGVGERVEELPDRMLVYTRDGDVSAAALAERNLPPHSTLVRRSTLEDVFLHLTGRTLVD
jgi:lipooligosaccharide transport system ATP-binding protein